MKCWLFAYGLLQSQFQPPKTMSQCKADRVRGVLYDLGPYPAAVAVGTADSWIDGELVEMELDELAELDKFEGTAEGIYERKMITTESGASAWVYEYLQPIPPSCEPLKRWNGPDE